MKRRREYYTKLEAAEYLGVRKWALDDLRHVDLGPPYIQRGEKILYRKRDLFKWGLANLTWVGIRPYDYKSLNF
jgi:hypothetical protein